MTSQQPWRDSAGRALSDYPRPSVAVDAAVLSVPVDDSGRLMAPSLSGLQVLLVHRNAEPGDEWLLPGTFLHEGERLADAVLRALRDKAGVRGLSPRQLKVFDAPDRDNRGWVLSVAHVVTVPWHRIAEATGSARQSIRPVTQLRPVEDAVGLPFDHDSIVAGAVDALRAEYLEFPDPAGLLPEPFTLRQLQHLHEAVLGGPVAKDSFRRRMEPRLEPVGGLSSGSVGKPARLFAQQERSGVRGGLQPNRQRPRDGRR